MMSVTIDPVITDLDEWAADFSMVDDWLFAMWGVVPGTSKPRRSGRIQSPPTTAGWLNAMWGFAA